MLRPLTTTSIGAGAPRLIVCEIRSPGSNAKIMSLGTAVGQLGRDAQLQELLAKPRADLLGQNLAQPLLQLEDIDAAPFAQADAEQAVVGASAPEIGHVDRELRRVAAGVAHRDVDVIGPDLLGDHVECLLGDLGGQLELGPLRRPHAELELAGVDPREKLAAQLAAHDDHDGAGRQQVGQHHLAPVRDRPVDDSLKSVLHPHEEPRPRLGPVAMAVRLRAGSPAARRRGPARTCWRAGTT